MAKITNLVCMFCGSHAVYAGQGDTVYKQSLRCYACNVRVLISNPSCLQVGSFIPLHVNLSMVSNEDLARQAKKDWFKNVPSGNPMPFHTSKSLVRYKHSSVNQDGIDSLIMGVESLKSMEKLEIRPMDHCVLVNNDRTNPLFFTITINPCQGKPHAIGYYLL